MSISSTAKLVGPWHAAPADIRTGLIAAALALAVVILLVVVGMASHLGSAIGDGPVASYPVPAPAPHVFAP